MHEPENDFDVVYHPFVVIQLNHLIDILYAQGYFGYMELAKQYVVRLKDYIEQNIPFLLKKPAPPHFTKYGKSMQYVTYNPNKQTTWYIFFQQIENRYLVRYITNNHAEGQYIR
ncbi:MAG: hypothetical protein LBM08_12420 [Dysgonamonadaceae bacterium]|jgi:hypothetical protein|nr:hypothetical protein [Dysgonamonadaceae bacterium]